MPKASTKSRRKLIKSEEAELHLLINDFQFIPGAPADEHDTLVHRLLSTLHSGAPRSAIADVISNNCIIALSSDEAAAVAESVWSWWIGKAPVSTDIGDRDA